MRTVDIYIISDSSGETGEAMARALMGQFPDLEARFLRYPDLTEPAEVDSVISRILDRSRKSSSLVVISVVLAEIHHSLVEACQAAGLPFIDLYADAITTIMKAFDVHPVMEAGMTRKLTSNYFDRISSMEFAVRYDDGKDPRGFLKADLILLGVSRTSKTPLSMFLATKGYNVANLPLLPEVDLAEEVFQADKRRIVGLTVSEAQLFEARKNRLSTLGIAEDADYIADSRIEKELAYARSVFDQLGCKVIDVTDSAIEVTAARIVNYLQETFGDEAKRQLGQEAMI